MKTHFVYGLLFALLTACTSSQYRIDGIYTAEDGTPVWLIDQNAKDTLAETAVRDGAFTFSGRIREPFFAYVGNGKQRIPLELYGVNAIPHLILFGPDGAILQRGLRGEDIYTTVADLLSR